MRPVLLISLLLLSTLFYEVQGRHLRRGDLPARNHRTNENGSIRRSGEKKIDACKDGQCSSSASAGRNRKLIAKTTSSTYSTTTTSKNLKNEGTKANPIPKDKSSRESVGVKKENFSVNSSPETGRHRDTSNKHYPNVFDLAGMDYSPARRNAPIHN